ncbi:MAG: peptidylprolyl isomerase [Candidatus Cloacimonetes bacterium]|nr:peptidylprolyl isomerase [Candidatus Cloacimonadota bacterium]MCF7812994.1 peptidylprolyl isomerase [Candidatus Cloacimonadota bacterium]MCF7867274.1 peptidylprolyl isomerase [Candidatus Cloacimonadota bacterium]MCF7882718.1 peptidylprolyl isomerase [Candidatus Cloacimonadota bacterium]
MQNKVLAKVNGKEITQFDVDHFLRSMGQERAAQFNNEEGRKRILDELVNQNLFLADAIDSKVEETAEFQNEMNRMKDVILTQVNINSTMRQVGIVEDEIEKYFQENKSKYDLPASANTSHILVEDEAKCNEIYDKLMKQEIDFAEAAKDHSKCPSSQKGGELGMYPRGQMVPEYEAVAFDMKVGDISKPVKTQFGYHIIKLNDKEEAKEADFAELKDKVAQDLKAKKQHEVYFNKLQDLKGKYNVEMM